MKSPKFKHFWLFFPDHQLVIINHNVDHFPDNLKLFLHLDPGPVHLAVASFNGDVINSLLKCLEFFINWQQLPRIPSLPISSRLPNKWLKIRVGKRRMALAERKQSLNSTPHILAT